MIIKIGKKRYKISNNLVVSSKKMLQQILAEVRQAADSRGIPEYYISFIVMMYVVSNTILSEFSPENIMDITENHLEE